MQSLTTNIQTIEAKLLTTLNNVLTTTQILDFYIQKDRFSIADILSFTFFGTTTSNIKAAEFYINGTKVFSGIVDSKKSVLNTTSKYTTIVCRSYPALMLDNEVAPTVYNSLSTSAMISTFASPFNITAPTLTAKNVGPIVAGKGMSYWGFIEQFCLKAYKKRPYIKQNSEISLEAFSDDTYFFADNSEDEHIPYIGASINDERFNMISKMHVKTRVNDGNIHYGYVLTNSQALNMGVFRERYYNCVDSDYVTHSKRKMSDKQLDFFEGEVIIDGLLNLSVGDSAVLAFSSSTFSNLYVSQVKIIGDSSGIKTKLKLWNKIGVL